MQNQSNQMNSDGTKTILEEAIENQTVMEDYREILRNINNEYEKMRFMQNDFSMQKMM